MVCRARARGQAQPVLLGSLALVTIALFAVTSLFVNSYERQQARLGEEWYRRGQADVRGGKTQQAVNDLRTALSYSRDPSYRLELARALVADGRTTEAREYLLSLWERQPGNAELNLELARVSAKSDAPSAAIGYYESAIHGVWDADPDTNRRGVRFELARYLVGLGDKQRAMAALFSLAAELPEEAAPHASVASLMLQAGNAEAARDEFRTALRFSPNYAAALHGAGIASYLIGDYRTAVRYLDSYLRQAPNDADAASHTKIAKAVLTLDPFQPRLSAAERRRRVLRMYQEADKRLKACRATFPPGSLSTAMTAAEARFTAQAGNAHDRTLRRDPDLLDNVFDAVYWATTASSTACGAQHPDDDAIALIAAGRGGQ
jgi:tetratricopeptide (TPR) repeat protein